MREETGTTYFGIDLGSNNQAGSLCLPGIIDILHVTPQFRAFSEAGCYQVGALWGGVELVLQLGPSLKHIVGVSLYSS